MQLPIPYHRGSKKPWPSIPRINWGHPLTRNLTTYVYDCGGGVLIDLVTGSIGKTVGTTNPASVIGAQVGQGTRWVDNGNNSTLGQGMAFATSPRQDNLTNALPYSFSAGFVPTSTTQGDGNVVPGAIFCYCDGTGSQNTPFVVAADNGAVGRVLCEFSNANSISCNGAFVVNVWSVATGVATSTGENGYLNANAVATNALTTTFTSTGFKPMINGQNFNTSPATFGNLYNGFTFFGAAWKGRALTAVEHLQLYYDPWCFLIYPEDEMFATLVGVVATTNLPFGQASPEQRPWRVRTAPFDQSVSLNPNLFKNPIPTLNLYDQAHPFWPSPYRPFPNGLNPNLFTNPFPIFNGEQSSGAKINPDWAPYPQVGINPNLQQNPVPFLNQFVPVKPPPWTWPGDQALNINLFTNPYPFNQYDYSHPFWPFPYRPLPDGLNPNIFKNPYPIQNVLGAPSSPLTSTKPVDAAYNQNLYTVTVVAAPFLNLFAPVAQPPLAKPTTDGLNPNLFKNPYPFLNPALPPAQAVLAKPLDAVYNPNLYTAVVAATPFNQTYWPSPSQVPSAPFDFNNFVLLVPPPTAIPFNQTYWPPAFPVPSAPFDFYNPTLFSAPATPISNFFYPPISPVPSAPFDFYNLVISQPAAPAPFNQTFWPPSSPVSIAPFDFYNLVISQPAVINPIVATDVFIPYTIRQTPAPPTGLNPNLFTNPVPLNQFHYPRAARTPQAPISFDFPFNPNLPPPVVTTFLIQRTLTGVGL